MSDFDDWDGELLSNGKSYKQKQRRAERNISNEVDDKDSDDNQSQASSFRDSILELD